MLIVNTRLGFLRSRQLLLQAIMDSPYHSRNQEDSGMFYVNDYCYYMWWLAAANSKSPESPGAHLLKVNNGTPHLIAQHISALLSQRSPSLRAMFTHAM